MGRVLAATVAVIDPETGQTVSFVKGDEPPDWAAALITNPRAWPDPEPIERIARAGATDEELEVFRAAWGQLSEQEQTDALEAEHDVTDDELRAQLVELRATAAERGISVVDAFAEALAEENTAPAAKPIDAMTKDELVAHAATHNIAVDAKAKKDEILDAIKAATPPPEG